MLHHKGGEEIVTEFKHVRDVLTKVEKERHAVEKKTQKVFALFEANENLAAEKMLPAIEETQDEIDQTLEDLLKELEIFTLKAAQKAQNIELTSLAKLKVISFIGLTIFLAVALFTVSSIVHPLSRIKDYALRLSNGELDAEAPTHKFKDEINDMLKALLSFKDSAQEAQELRSQQIQIQENSKRDQEKAMQVMADNFEGAVGGSISNLAAAATELRSSSEGMKSIAEHTSRSSATVASSSGQASANVNTVASAMEEMSATSAEIASQITSVKKQSSDTSKNADIANDKVSTLNCLVEGISEVVLSIKDIAEQTNLLALNATIEAARAGEAGKGFAVVADEVKKLSTETSRKTEEINKRIEDIQQATRESVESVALIINSISEIDISVAGVSAAVEEQNVTTNEIVRSVTEASQGVENVNHTIVDIQKASEETGASADDVLSASREVSELAENLKLSVSEFLSNVRKKD
ncbi:MAG: methyl-accepting chemotaxis protein [Alphaproteobacteria bacterium]